MKIITVPQKYPLFDEIIDTFQGIYPNKPCVIAGGAVRDFMLGKSPKDIDVFFLGLDWNKESKDLFRQKLDAAGIYYQVATSSLPWHRYEKYLLLSIIWKTCRELIDIGAEIQFCGFPGRMIAGLMKTFDWEICLFSYTGGQIYTSARALSLIEQIQNFWIGEQYDAENSYKPPRMRLCNVQFPVSNLRRGFKFEAHYPIKLDYKSILKLCNAVITEDRNG